MSASQFETVRVLNAQMGSFSTVPSQWLHRKTIPFTIIAQVMRGSYVLAVGRKSETIAVGEAVLVASNLPVSFLHRADARGVMAARWLHVQTLYHEALDPCAIYAMPHRIAGNDAKRIGENLDKFARLDNQTSPRASLSRSAAVLNILSTALATARELPNAREKLSAVTRFAPLTAWLMNNLHRPLQIDDLAGQAGLSRSRLHAAFQKYLRRSPMDHLRELRLDAAARLMLNGNQPVAAVAEATGFANAFHFSRVFSARFGVPPRRYRLEHERLLSLS